MVMALATAATAATAAVRAALVSPEGAASVRVRPADDLESLALTVLAQAHAAELRTIGFPDGTEEEHLGTTAAGADRAWAALLERHPVLDEVVGAARALEYDRVAGLLERVLSGAPEERPQREPREAVESER